MHAVCTGLSSADRGLQPCFSGQLHHGCYFGPRGNHRKCIQTHKLIEWQKEREYKTPICNRSVPWQHQNGEVVKKEVCWHASNRRNEAGAPVQTWGASYSRTKLSHSAKWLSWLGSQTQQGNKTVIWRPLWADVFFLIIDSPDVPPTLHSFDQEFQTWNILLFCRWTFPCFRWSASSLLNFVCDIEMQMNCHYFLVNKCLMVFLASDTFWNPTRAKLSTEALISYWWCEGRKVTENWEWNVCSARLTVGGEGSLRPQRLQAFRQVHVAPFLQHLSGACSLIVLRSLQHKHAWVPCSHLAD